MDQGDSGSHLFRIVNRNNNMEVDVPAQDRDEFAATLNRLAELGWDQVQWGTGSIRMKAEAQQSVMQAKSGSDMLVELIKGVAEISELTFVECFGDGYMGYLRGDADTHLEAARLCLADAERMHNCPHPDAVNKGDSVCCPDCNLKRYKTTAEIIADLRKGKRGLFHLKTTHADGVCCSLDLEIVGYATISGRGRIAALTKDEAICFRQLSEDRQEKRRTFMGHEFVSQEVTLAGIYEVKEAEEEQHVADH